MGLFRTSTNKTESSNRSSTPNHDILPPARPSTKQNFYGAVSIASGDRHVMESSSRPVSRSSRRSTRSGASRDHDVSARPVSEFVSGQSAPPKAQQLLGIEKEDGERPVNFARAWLSRGRHMSRSSSKNGEASSPSPDSEKSLDPPPPPSTMFSRRRTRNLDRDRSPKALSISNPYNVQHIVHGSARQFSKIDNTTQNDLVAEFSAVRASQTSRNLRGFKITHLHSRQSSSDNTVPSTVPSLVSESSQDSSRNSQLICPASPQSIRSTRSKESFSQPFRNRNSQVMSRSQSGKSPRFVGSQVFPTSYGSTQQGNPDPALVDDSRRESMASVSGASEVMPSHPENVSEDKEEDPKDVHAISTPGQTAWYGSPDTEYFDSTTPTPKDQEKGIDQTVVQVARPSYFPSSSAVRRTKSENGSQRSSIMRSESQQSTRTVKQVHFSDSRSVSSVSTSTSQTSNPQKSSLRAETPSEARSTKDHSSKSQRAPEPVNPAPTIPESAFEDPSTPTPRKLFTIKKGQRQSTPNLRTTPPTSPLPPPPPPKTPIPTSELPPLPAVVPFPRRVSKDPHNFHRATIACSDNAALQERFTRLDLHRSFTRDLKRPGPTHSNTQPLPRPRSAVKNRTAVTTETQSLYNLPTGSRPVRNLEQAQEHRRVQATGAKLPRAYTLAERQSAAAARISSVSVPSSSEWQNAYKRHDPAIDSPSSLMQADLGRSAVVT